MTHKTLILLLTFSLCGCQQVQIGSQYIPDHSKDYLDSTVVAHLNVPEGLTKPRDLETYPIPTPIPEPSELESVNLEPPEFGRL